MHLNTRMRASILIDDILVLPLTLLLCLPIGKVEADLLCIYNFAFERQRKPWHLPLTYVLFRYVLVLQT